MKGVLYLLSTTLNAHWGRVSSLAPSGFRLLW
jgi:hypothetical protein